MNSVLFRTNHKSLVSIKPGQQIFLTYGPFSNKELAQYYGFVIPNLQGDYVELNVEVKEEELELRMSLLEKHRLSSTNYLVLGSLSERLLAAMRICLVDTDYLFQQRDHFDPFRPQEKNIEEAILQSTLDSLQALLDNFPTTMTEDKEELTSSPTPAYQRTGLYYRMEQKKILLHNIETLEALLDQTRS